ncbi:MAG: hypothetical protein D8M58_16710 [Calditrichaeota bacterium]|nr:MAG: hypothetical protein DWQ03_08440 [Calditrichota bacterium]MBL1207048.1 hypothetical protein [Calditrichota bacterium]NOG46876.1 hypothetical protein [Calditrichota bacterium]
MSEMNYELFIRKAFAFNLGENVSRSGDPASLADADHVRHNNITGFKVGTAYSMEIFIDHLINDKAFDGDENDRIEAFPTRVLAVNTMDEIINLIDEFESTILPVYFETQDGEYKLK